jgi:pimeloyl-ACP methyl ester carboxylesterase
VGAARPEPRAGDTGALTPEVLRPTLVQHVAEEGETLCPQAFRTRNAPCRRAVARQMLSGGRVSRAARGVWRRGLRRVVATVAALVVVTVAAAGYDVASEGAVPAPPLGSHSHWVRTGDIESHYEQWGDAGPPIVLVHGFLESAAVWDRVGPVLARDGYRVHALDVRGFGYTERRGPYTVASDTAQLSAFLSAMRPGDAGGGPAVLVGHSSGAAIVGALARARPADVRGVVFLDGDGTPYGVGPAWVHRLVLDPYATAVVRLLTRHPWVAERVYRGTCGQDCPAFDATAWLRPFRLPGARPQGDPAPAAHRADLRPGAADPRSISGDLRKPGPRDGCCERAVHRGEAAHRHRRRHPRGDAPADAVRAWHRRGRARTVRTATRSASADAVSLRH